jgi:hypothetical protein
MHKPEDNVRITRVGPGTPMGNLIRRSPRELTAKW